MTPTLPQHIAMIMDGNGRWARTHNLPRGAGHEAGIKTAQNMVIACAEKGIEILSLFAFGHENWKRPKMEVNFLMNLFIKGLQQETDKLKENNIRLQIIGDHLGLNKNLQAWIKKAQETTAQNTGLRLIVALNYSGRWDLIHAINKLIQQAKEHKKSINENMLSAALSTSNIPDPDLLIRTSGEQRISNFMLWQCAYTELYFTKTPWPDFDLPALEDALAFFASRERRFGKITEQIKNA